MTMQGTGHGLLVAAALGTDHRTDCCGSRGRRHGAIAEDRAAVSAHWANRLRFRVVVTDLTWWRRSRYSFDGL